MGNCLVVRVAGTIDDRDEISDDVNDPVSRDTLREIDGSPLSPMVEIEDDAGARHRLQDCCPDGAAVVDNEHLWYRETERLAAPCEPFEHLCHLCV